MARGGKREGAGRPPGAKNKVLPSGFLELEEQAITVLRAHLDEGNEKVAQFVFEQIHGKARQKLEHTGEDGGPISHQIEELANDIFAPTGKKGSWGNKGKREKPLLVRA